MMDVLLVRVPRREVGVAGTELVEHYVHPVAAVLQLAGTIQLDAR
jgi:hypothetical protein